MAKEKKMTMDSPEFGHIRDCSNELGPMLCKYLADNSLSVAHGLSVLASATITVIENLCAVIGEDPKEMLNTYVEGLKVGFEEELKHQKKL